MEVLQGCPHRWGQTGRVAELELHPPPSPVLEEEQIQLGTGVSRPEVGRFGLDDLQHLFHGVALPRSANLGVRQQILDGLDSQQRMQQTAVPQIYLGGLHLPLPQVFVPRMELSDQVEPAE